jgi:preprotein translocase subunit SecG
MFVFFTIVHVLLSIFMIFVILLQPGKDAGMGAALGGGAATSAFGGRGAATFLTKLTAICAVGFFVTSLGLSFVGLKTSVADSIMDSPETSAPAQTPTPVGTGTVPTEAAPASPTEAAPKAAPTENSPSPNDAVPAEKLPN